MKESEQKYREAYNLINFYKDLFAHDMNNILQAINSTIEYFSAFHEDQEELEKVFRIAKIIF